MANNEIAKQVSELLLEYGDRINDEVQKVLPDVVDKGVQELKQKSGTLFKKHGKGPHYADSWTKKEWKNSKYYNGYTIHNRKYQLTHLLEKGHAKRNGGRVEGRPHIAPVEKMTEKELIEGVTEAVEGASK